MNKKILILVLTAVILGSGIFLWAGDNTPTVEFKKDGELIAINDETEHFIVETLEEIIAGCWLDSETNPDFFRPNLQVEWEEKSQKSYVKVSYKRPITIYRNQTGKDKEKLPIIVSEILLPFYYSFPGSYMTRHNGNVRAYIKCSGPGTLNFICSEGIKEHTPKGYRSNCHLNL